VVCGLAAVWLINLYNFMDGIDGLAGGEAVSVALTALILLAGKGRSDLAAGAGLAGASALGFLFWNWPPAKIFMGDVGSGFLGVILAGLALASAFEPGPWPVVWLILLALFGVDATVTLARRLARKARVYQAHREHAYQHAARRWGHRRVSMAALAVNLGYLFPLAWISLHYPAWALDYLASAWLRLIGLALVLGAGRPESSQ
jgi:Fuc2NAc and GlcNAc transferase